MVLTVQGCRLSLTLGKDLVVSAESRAGRPLCRVGRRGGDGAGVTVEVKVTTDDREGGGCNGDEGVGVMVEG